MIIHGDSLEELKKLEDRYSIFPNGTIINKVSGKEVVFSKDHKGYLKARLYTSLSKHKDGRKPYRQHRVVAMKYLSDYSSSLQVNHINGIKDDNNIKNLEMVTNSQNAKHGWGLESNKDRINKLTRDPITGRFVYA